MLGYYPIMRNTGTQMVEVEEIMDAKRVEGRVTDWVARLNRLYSQLDRWAREVPDARVERKPMQQLIEPIMERFAVPARDVPTYTVFVNAKYRIAFVPSSVWIMGANGRVDVSTNVRHHSLVDIGGKGGKPSNWCLVGNDPNKPLIPFNRQAFLKLVGERK